MTERKDRGALPLEPHYSTIQAARILGYTPGHLRDLRVKNAGPRWIRLPTGMVRYPESALRDYLSGVAA